MTQTVFAALLAGEPAAFRLLPSRFAEPAAWQLAAERAGSRSLAPGLLEELVRQSQDLPPSAARTRNLEALARPGTTLVVTGQQVGLLGGPLYTLHKAATAIARARMVQALTGRPCVPLFWLQTEDHDYAEIAELALSVSGQRVALALPAEPVPTRVSLAQRVLPPQIDGLLDRLEQELRPLPHAAEVLALARAHYAPGRPIGAAFAGLLAELWREEGLVVLNPRVPAVARLAVPLYARVLREHAAISSALHERAQALAQAGYAEQVATRASASLVFFHVESAAGPRYRLVRDERGWQTPAGELSEAALLELLAREPLRFSSSALLRPLLQDSLLPSCAYVGGPAEVSYFAQLPPLYERFELPMPLIAPRARLRVVDSATASLLRKLGLQPAELDAPRQALLARVVAHADPAVSAAAVQARLLAPLERELEALAALGLPSVEASLRRTRDTCRRSIVKLAAKLEQSALERDHSACSRLDRVLTALRPDAVPQERAYGFLALAARAGTASLTRAILAGAASLDPGVRDVYP